ncbi:MAG: hypothetical protein H6606_09940 [Flavobacteriales bacterium]|nr:hypothetical protein [Flavobacteriales bacterium]
MRRILSIFLLLQSLNLFAQNDAPKPVTNHFYSSRVVNSHTTMSPEAKTLDFRINHRFGEISNGAYEFFGLDQAMMRIGFDYGVTDKLAVGIGRSTFEKTFDGFVKYRILQQEEGKGNNPVTLSLVSGMSLNSLKWANPDRTNLFTSRLSYNNQILVSRKFNEKFTIQLMPTMIHRNLIDSFQYKNDVYSMGVALRQKIVPQVTLNLEYFYVFPNQISPDYTHPLSIGIDISTGWHTFQLHVTNATGTFEKAVITQTANRWDKGQLHFGFNISREFHLGGY